MPGRVANNHESLGLSLPHACAGIDSTPGRMGRLTWTFTGVTSWQLSYKQVKLGLNHICKRYVLASHFLLASEPDELLLRFRADIYQSGLTLQVRIPIYGLFVV